MRNPLLANNKLYIFVLFIILEIISFVLIVNYNNKQKDIFLYSSNLFSGYINSKYTNWLNYLKLKNANEQLKKDNAYILQHSFNKNTHNVGNSNEKDTLPEKEFNLIPATICNKSIDKRNNRMTLDQGSSAGIKKDMGVIDAYGIVGVVRKVNSNYASVVPLINTISRVSVLIKNKGYFGILEWEPYDYRKIKLTSIPKHANIENGDTIITSGFSTIFPKGIFVGTIEEIQLVRGSNYFDITVHLNNDLALVENVYVIENLKKYQKEEVEK
jgi:rod shape-determining protein MreC